MKSSNNFYIDKFGVIFYKFNLEFDENGEYIKRCNNCPYIEDCDKFVNPKDEGSKYIITTLMDYCNDLNIGKKLDYVPIEVPEKFRITLKFISIKTVGNIDFGVFDGSAISNFKFSKLEKWQKNRCIFCKYYEMCTKIMDGGKSLKTICTIENNGSRDIWKLPLSVENKKEI